MQSGCGCRGDNGLAHYQCLANKAPYQPHRGDASWRSCQTCLRPFTGEMRNSLALAWINRSLYHHNRDEFLRAVSHMFGCVLADDNEGRHGPSALCGWYGWSDSVALMLSFLQVNFPRQVEGGETIIEFGRFRGYAFQFLITPGMGTTWRDWFLSAQGSRLTDDIPQASELRRWLLAQAATSARLGGLIKPTDVKPATGRTDAEQVLRLTTTVRDDPKALVFKGHLALALSNASRFRESNRLFRVVLGEMARVHGTRHPSTMQIHQHYALSLLQQGLFSAAERANRKLLGVLTATYGESNSSTMACIANLAASLTEQGKCAEATSQLQRLLAHQRRVFGHDHPSTCKTTRHLSELTKRERKLVEHAAARKRRCALACLRESGSSGLRIRHLHPRVVLGEVRPTRPIMNTRARRDSTATAREPCKRLVKRVQLALHGGRRAFR